MLLFFLLPISLGAQNVMYAFQSASDKDQMIFVKSSDENRTILYVSEKCRSCMASLKRIKNSLIQRKVSVVISTNNLNYLRGLVKKNTPEMGGFIYYDPGRRFQKEMNLSSARFSYIVFSRGRYKKYDGRDSMVPKPSLMIK